MPPDCSLLPYTRPRAAPPAASMTSEPESPFIALINAPGSDAERVLDAMERAGRVTDVDGHVNRFDRPFAQLGPDIRDAKLPGQEKAATRHMDAGRARRRLNSTARSGVDRDDASVDDARPTVRKLSQRRGELRNDPLAVADPQASRQAGSPSYWQAASWDCRGSHTWLLVSSTMDPSRRSYITAPPVPVPPAVLIWQPPRNGRYVAVSTATRRDSPTSTTSVPTNPSSPQFA